MSGTGRRFANAGYKTPKPLIDIDGMPIIKHVVNLFPGEDSFIFVCNRLHLENTNMKSILQKIAPPSEIVAIDPHKKGPVYAVSQVFDKIDDYEEVIVNYCDFGTYWNYDDFLIHTRERNADGAIVAYRGFHPHMLGTTNYAFMREKDQWLLEIKEKEPFTNNRMEEYASNGTYYFRKGEYVKKFFTLLMKRNNHVNNEFYVSLIYNLMVEDGLRISIYKIQHMLQWGTPKDMEEYLRWSNYFRQSISATDNNVIQEDNTINLIPLAGTGFRFQQEGYSDPKPLIKVNGNSMVIQACKHLPESKNYVFICVKKHLDSYPLRDTISEHFPKAIIIGIDKITEGQACTCEIGLQNVSLESPLLIAACDNGMLWDKNQYQELLDNPDIDAIVWSFKNHPPANVNPQMYGWLNTEGNNVYGVSVKKAICDNPQNDHGIIGTFYFRKAKYFITALRHLYDNNVRVNSEFYVDSCIGALVNLGYKVKSFPVRHYVSWGTPDELRTYQYWQSFFHKASWHPYSLEKDYYTDNSSVDELTNKFHDFFQDNR